MARAVTGWSPVIMTVFTPALRAAVAPHADAEIGPVADVAAAIDLLIDPGAAGITGQIVYLGGA